MKKIKSVVSRVKTAFNREGIRSRALLAAVSAFDDPTVKKSLEAQKRSGKEAREAARESKGKATVPYNPEWLPEDRDALWKEDDWSKIGMQRKFCYVGIATGVHVGRHASNLFAAEGK